ncbi:HAD-IIA family hydrolase [Microlunatus sagamiharensis]|uniref:HAD-IIA family hydrolase n=1 Tax=Microlunatus sagamiharensis TaxID=546874 RepID=UPI001E3914DE|nr:HAD-IIA family hydrolase [Microlunatus sagamiharensis]
MAEVTEAVGATGSPALVDAYDGVLFDLDGVIYLGPVAVPGAPPALAGLRERGVPVGFVTNNAARTPGAVAEHLTELGIPAERSDVVTSAQAGAQVLRHDLPAGTKVLLVGGDGVREALAEAGLSAVESADDEPVAVLQGYGVDLTWQQLIEASIAINRGARWVATNDDPTRPTDRGLVPGNGAAVQAVRLAVTVDPEVAGKPYRPLLDETIARLGVHRPLFVGDRLDTDIAGAVNAGLDGMLVLSGSHGPADLLVAGPGTRPTHLGLDAGALLQPERSVTLDGDRACCGSAVARVEDGRLLLEGDPPTTAQGWAEATWAAAHLAWRAMDEGHPLDLTAVLPVLARPSS